MKIKILESVVASRHKVVCRECGDGDVVYVKEFRCFFTPDFSRDSKGQGRTGAIRTMGNGGKEDYLFCRSCEAEYDCKSYRNFLLKYYEELSDK